MDKLKHPLNITVVWKEMHLRMDNGTPGRAGYVILRLPAALQQALWPPNRIHEVVRATESVG
jgi:hypothetical protein